jgi:hypothetical protein
MTRGRGVGVVAAEDSEVERGAMKSEGASVSVGAWGMVVGSEEVVEQAPRMPVVARDARRSEVAARGV